MKARTPQKNRILKHFRFSQAMIEALEREHARTRRPRTTILEEAFGRYMLVKATERDRMVAAFDGQ